MALTADDHEDGAGDLGAGLEVLAVHLEVDRGAGAIVLADAVDVLGRAAAYVLPDRVFGEPALAHSLGAELEADVVLLLAGEQALGEIVRLRHERPVIAVEGPLARDVRP